jgi:hypothetical protein
MAKVPAFEDIGKTLPSFEEIGKEPPTQVGLELPYRGEPAVLRAAPEPSFSQKWKEYFFSRGDEGRWTKPGRYEKFLNYTHWPVKTSLQAMGSIMMRANKFVTAVSPVPEGMRALATLDPTALKGIFPSIWDARRVFYPVPGAADELKTWGEAMADDWYEPLTGDRPPDWYIPVMDAAFETLLIAGPAAQRASQASKASFTNAKLTSTEIKAAKRIFSHEHLARMQPVVVRSILARESTITTLSKAEKAQLLSRGYKPIQIQNMTPLQAFQVMDDVPIAESAASKNLASATKQATDRLTAAIKRAKRLHPQKERMISQEKSRRVAIAQKIRERETGEQALFYSRRPLKGEYPVPAFTTPDIAPADRYYLMESLRTSKMPYFRYQDTGRALLKVLGVGDAPGGTMPTRREVALLERHFGKGIAKALLGKRSAGKKVWDATLEIINIPRATLASIDMSFPLRQGGMLIPGHPKQWAKSFGQMIKAGRPGTKGKEYARYLEDLAESNRYADLRRRAGIEVTEWGMSNITAREEPFLSSWAEWIPGVKWSNRVFTTMSNQLRINVFDDVARNWERAGMSWATHPTEYKKLASFLNHATGRGTIGEKYAGITPYLNAAFFSPRYQISRPQIVYDAFVSLKNPAARKVIIGDLVKYVGTGTAAMILLDQIDGVEVEMNPKHNEFGKVKVGNTRYDFWSGNAQIARLIAQVSAGEGIPKSGKPYELNRLEIIENYIRTKLSPPAGLAWDILDGETFLGEEMVFEPTFLARDIPKRVAPMVMQDIVDAVRFQGLDGVLPITSTTAFFGGGVGTWEPSKWSLLFREQDDLALSTYGMEWDKLNEAQQQLLKRDNKLLANLEREAVYERTIFPFLEEMKKKQLEAGFDIEAGLLKGTQKELERLKVRVGLLPRTWGSWTLNDERFAKYKSLLIKELQSQLNTIFKADDWRTKKKDLQIRMAEKAIDNAKAKAKMAIRIEAKKNKPQLPTFEQIK